jgi:hypothetical protein
MKIIFVGVHYKKGKKALCSSTYTGKIIDKIIEKLGPEYICEKTNLFPCTYLPCKSERKRLNLFYLKKNCLYVGLGAIVRDHLQDANNFISVLHPGGIRYKGITPSEYVDNTVQEIINFSRACT